MKTSTFPLFGCFFFFNPQKCLEKLFTTREKLQEIREMQETVMFFLCSSQFSSNALQFDALNTSMMSHETNKKKTITAL